MEGTARTAEAPPSSPLSQGSLPGRTPYSQGGNAQVFILRPHSPSADTRWPRQHHVAKLNTKASLPSHTAGLTSQCLLKVPFGSSLRISPHPVKILKDAVSKKLLNLPFSFYSTIFIQVQTSESSEIRSPRLQHPPASQRLPALTQSGPLTLHRKASGWCLTPHHAKHRPLTLVSTCLVSCTPLAKPPQNASHSFLPLCGHAHWYSPHSRGPPGS